MCGYIKQFVQFHIEDIPSLLTAFRLAKLVPSAIRYTAIPRNHTMSVQKMKTSKFPKVELLSNWSVLALLVFLFIQMQVLHFLCSTWNNSIKVVFTFLFNLKTQTSCEGVKRFKCFSEAKERGVSWLKLIFMLHHQQHFCPFTFHLLSANFKSSENFCPTCL